MLVAERISLHITVCNAAVAVLYEAMHAAVVQKQRMKVLDVNKS